MTRTMYDSVTVGAIPQDGAATAGYVNGRYTNSAAMRSRFPHLPHVSIAVFASADAMCLDVEPGDATVAQAPGWCDRQHARGVDLPIIYTSASQVASVRAAMGARRYLLWSAHYTGRAHICGAGCGYPAADATQWIDRGPHGENVDITLMSDRFYAAISGGTVAAASAAASPAPASPAPAPPEETDMLPKIITSKGPNDAASNDDWLTLVLSPTAWTGLSGPEEVALAQRWVGFCTNPADHVMYTSQMDAMSKIVARAEQRK